MIIRDRIELETRPPFGIFDITEKTERFVRDSRIDEGLCTIFAPGSTCAITTIEFEPGLASDMESALDRLFPKDISYEHERRWRDGNGHSHIRASFLGQSLVVPIAEGRLLLGTWQQIIFLELDNKPRTRTIVVQMMGE